MKKILLSVSLAMLFFSAHSQLLTWSPQFPSDNSTLVITVDASKGNQGLFNYSDPNNIYVHCGIISNLNSTAGSPWRYVNGVYDDTWGAATAGVKAVSLGNNKYQFTINNIRTFFAVPQGETILKVAILFRDANANQGSVKKQANADGSDMFIPVYPSGTNGIQFTNPAIVPAFNLTNEVVSVTLGQPLPVSAAASSGSGTLKMYYDGALAAGPVTGSSVISASPVVSAAGNHSAVAELFIGGSYYYDTLSFYLPPSNTILSLPSGVKEGINYWSGCDSVTLVLYAPNKTNAVLLGDFEPGAWQPLSKYQMNKTPDGNYYWITVKGLTGGTEYSFQYLVDNSIYIADPYSEKILDPWNDQYIPAATYPGLKAYPSDVNVSAGKNGYVSILQTCRPAYNWKVEKFVKPDKRNLVIYELLMRDFGDARNYQMLIDTISYFKRLGINAIELMPVNEFSGNESWGYNPTFYCALDKAYGTKNKFKEFIDLCHQNGIAVILDVVYNHLDSYNSPEGKLYWDAANGRPAVNNPWLNQSAPHPYSVFEDLNHTSTATQYWVERALDYWIAEYKVDGYRFDLAKGFTQKATDATTVEDFDGTRVTNLYRYYDYIVPKYPGTYIILEFLGQQRMEEGFYAGHGFLLWSKNTDTYNQATMGYSSNSDFSKIMYTSDQTKFSTPSAVGYMESHDEERLMYKNLQYGNISGGYNVKDTATALVRQAAAAAVFLTTPGPKMIWQFGERGYDLSIGYGGDRVASKPPKWEYMSDPKRLKLWDTYSKMINLRLAFPDLFTKTTFKYNFNDNGGLFKTYQISDSSSTNGVKLNIVANLDVTAQTRTVTFQNTGSWLNYITNGTSSGVNGNAGSIVNIGSTSQSITLQPGEYHIYFYQPANVYVFNGSGNWNDAANWTYGLIPPASLSGSEEIIISPKTDGECLININRVISPGAKITVMAGKKLRIL
jgi:glycosidase